MAGTTVAPVSRRQSKAPIDVFLRGRAGDQVLGVMCEFLGKRFFSKLFIVSMVHFSSVHFSCPAWRGWMMASFITWRYWCWSTSFAILATGDKCQNCMCWYFEGWFLQLTTSSSNNNNNNPFLKEKGAAATTTKKQKRQLHVNQATAQHHQAMTCAFRPLSEHVHADCQLQELWLWFSKPSSTLLHPGSSQWYWRWAHLEEAWPLDSEGMCFCPHTVHTYTVSLGSYCTTVCLQERDPLCVAVMDIVTFCWLVSNLAFLV